MVCFLFAFLRQLLLGLPNGREGGGGGGGGGGRGAGGLNQCRFTTCETNLSCVPTAHHPDNETRGEPGVTPSHSEMLIFFPFFFLSYVAALFEGWFVGALWKHFDWSNWGFVGS